VTISLTQPLTCFWKLTSSVPIARIVREPASVSVVTAALARVEFLPGYQQAL